MSEEISTTTTPTPAPAPAPSELDQAAASTTEPAITGTVVWFSAEKGYGFIAAEGHDRDLYVNASELPQGRTTLTRGAIVRCGTKPGDEGVEAARVEVLSEPEPSELDQAEEPAITGTVKWFNSEKGFGFIATAGGDLFVGASQLPAGRTTLAPGTTVRCGVRTGKKGKVAARVEVVSEPAPRPSRPPVRVPARPPSEPSERDLAVARIAEVLGESEPGPLEQLRRIIGRLGPARVEELLARVDEVEAAGRARSRSRWWGGPARSSRPPGQGSQPSFSPFRWRAGSSHPCPRGCPFRLCPPRFWCWSRPVSGGAWLMRSAMCKTG